MVVLAESGEEEKREPGEKTSEKKHRTERNKNQKGQNKKKNETDKKKAAARNGPSMTPRKLSANSAPWGPGMQPKVGGDDTAATPGTAAAHGSPESRRLRAILGMPGAPAEDARSRLKRAVSFNTTSGDGSETAEATRRSDQAAAIKRLGAPEVPAKAAVAAPVSVDSAAAPAADQSHAAALGKTPLVVPATDTTRVPPCMTTSDEDHAAEQATLSPWCCGTCEMFNEASAGACTLCTSTRTGSPTENLRHLLVHGDELVARAQDGEERVTSAGQLMGPTGQPLRHPAGLADRRLRIEREQSLDWSGVTIFGLGVAQRRADCIAARVASKDGEGGPVPQQREVQVTTGLREAKAAPKGAAAPARLLAPEKPVKTPKRKACAQPLPNAARSDGLSLALAASVVSAAAETTTRTAAKHAAMRKAEAQRALRRAARVAGHAVFHDREAAKAAEARAAAALARQASSVRRCERRASAAAVVAETALQGHDARDAIVAAQAASVRSKKSAKRQRAKAKELDRQKGLLEELVLKQQQQCPGILAELQQNGRKMSCWAWWVFPTEYPGASEPPPATAVSTATAGALLQQAPPAWRACLEEVGALVASAERAGRPSDAVLPHADHGRVQGFVKFWQSVDGAPAWLPPILKVLGDAFGTPPAALGAPTGTAAQEGLVIAMGVGGLTDPGDGKRRIARMHGTDALTPRTDVGVTAGTVHEGVMSEASDGPTPRLEVVSAAAAAPLGVPFAPTFIVDSGAGETFVTTEIMEAWGGPQGEQVEVEDVNGVRTTASGGGPVFAVGVDAQGQRRRVQIAQHMFTAPTFSSNLLSLGALTRGLNAQVRLDRDNPHIAFIPPTLRTVAGNLCRGGRQARSVLPLHEKGNLWLIDVEIEPFDAAVGLETNTRQCRPVLAKYGRPFSVPGRDEHDDADDADNGGQPTQQRTTKPKATRTLNPNARLPRAPKIGWGQASSPKTAKREQQESDWVYYHNCFNHRDQAVRDMVHDGRLKDVVAEPRHWRCPGCELAKAQRAGFGTKARGTLRDKASLRPYGEVIMDIYGPLKCGDRNHFEYLAAFTDVATNFAWAQPMQHKSQAVLALRSYVKHIDATRRFVEGHLGYQPGVIKLGTLGHDRDGAFTTTWGSTASEFDEVAATLTAARRFATPGTPQTGTVIQERKWRSMREAGDASMITSGLPERFKYDALLMAVQVGNAIDCEGNLLGDGEAPLKTLGLEGQVEQIVPFGNPCTIKFDNVQKGKLATRTGRIIGMGTDTPGYRVLLDPLPGAAADAPDEIHTSTHVTPRRAGQLWGPNEQGVNAVLPPRPPDVPAEEYVPLPTAAEMQALDAAAAGQPEVTRVPAAQTVGAAPGSAGSRAALLPRAARGRPKAPSQRASISQEAARAKAKDAQARNLRFALDQENPKQPGKTSHKRYDRYKVARSFADLAVFRRELCDGAPTWTLGDLYFDVQHGYMVFEYPLAAGSTPAAEPVAAVPPKHPELDAVPISTVDQSGHDDDDADEDVDGYDPFRPDPRGDGQPSIHSMRLRHPVGAKSGKVIDDEPLNGSEREVMEALKGWHAPDAVHSRRDSSGLGDLPLRVVRAAVVTVLGGATLEDVAEPGPLPKKIFDIRDVTKPDLQYRELPRNMKELRMQPDWLTGILPAIKTEIEGIIRLGVFEEVLKESWMNVIPTHRLDIIKPEKYKSRFVAQGNRTIGGGVHYDATATSMAAQVALKVVVAFAAGEKLKVFGIDYAQAFLRAKCENPNLYVMLPELPPEMKGGVWGSGRGSGKVGHLKKSLYGLCDSPRNWQRHLLEHLTTDVGVTVLASDRNCFKFSWRGMTLIGGIHVDDVIYAGAPAIRAEFLRRIKLTQR